ncbi:MAG: asparagine synthase (glutamine-hydrolyzing) [Candidatus Magasanikbacteria bacterium]|nr:asparagine synthase (glutamine-hydrolyzing) [Candidatus Magasanikbacteria bacterium]
MCGIVGIAAKNSKNYGEQLDRAVVSLRHRGPDGHGAHYFNNCVLGHARLSIVDLSTGDQPMLLPDKSVGITFNGEIYGFKAIKDKLVDYAFKTTSDTEVILALYQKYGSGLTEHLPGMFAFAIWDENKQELYCARDRFGEKPFYYAFGKNGEFIFASEIKAILTTGLINPVLDFDSLTHYLQRLYVHPTKTIYKNIFTLPPAHALSLKNGNISTWRYWQLPITGPEVSMNEAVEQFKTLLDQAVAKQLVADVPVSAFLSGGLDSSTIVALASKHKSDLMTFSFGFDDSLSELPFAREAATLNKTQHTELFESDYDIADLLVKMQDIYDEPFADSSNIPTYLISKLARQHSIVVLTGDGGDELLGGYRNWYQPLYFMKNGGDYSLAKLFTRTLITSFGMMSRNRRQYWYRYLGLKLNHKFDSVVFAHNSQNSYFSDSDLNDLLKFTPNAVRETAISFTADDTLNDAMKMDLENYMPGDILVKIDRAAMANSLELRAPFLDVDFASYCISLPDKLKIMGDNDKLILRQAFAESLPATIRNRGKQGFGAPVKKWLNYTEVKSLINNYLDNPNGKIYNFISFERSRRYRRINNYQTWILLVLSIWMEKHDFSISDLR